MRLFAIFAAALLCGCGHGDRSHPAGGRAPIALERVPAGPFPTWKPSPSPTPYLDDGFICHPADVDNPKYHCYLAAPQRAELATWLRRIPAAKRSRLRYAIATNGSANDTNVTFCVFLYYDNLGAFELLNKGNMYYQRYDHFVFPGTPS